MVVAAVLVLGDEARRTAEVVTQNSVVVPRCVECDQLGNWSRDGRAVMDSGKLLAPSATWLGERWKAAMRV